MKNIEITVFGRFIRNHGFDRKFFKNRIIYFNQVFFILLFFLMIDTTKGNGQDYFPLQVGNRWVFDLLGWPGYSSQEIEDTTRINEKVYYRFCTHETGLNWPFYTYYRSDSLGQVWIKGGPDGEHIVYKLAVPAGTDWYKHFDDLTYHLTLIDTSSVVSTPAGLFMNCYEYQTTIEEIFTDFIDWLAPNVGLVRRESEGIGYILKGAWVNGILYGDTTTTGVEKCVNKSFPQACMLFQNYPNPFNSSTIIKYDLPESDQVSLKIYNIEGKLVTELVNKIQLAGVYQVIWDGKDNHQETVTSGIYFCQFKTRQYWQTVRLILLK